MNIVERAVADALLITIRRIEAMPGSWHGLTDELDSTLRGRLAKHTDALNAFLALPNGHVEMRTVEINGTYVVIIGRDRVPVLLRRPKMPDAIEIGSTTMVVSHLRMVSD